jgi:electron transfer flavoprotein alpha subunit
MNQGFWVIVEQKNEGLLDVSLETLSEMTRVAGQMGEEVSAVLMGNEAESLFGPLGRYGAKKIYFVKSEIFEQYCSTVYVRQLIELIDKLRPRLIVAGATSSVQDYFPRVAAIVKAALVTNCSLITPRDDGNLQLSKPMYGGRVYANIMANGPDVTMATVRPGAFSIGKPDASSKEQIIAVEPLPSPEDSAIKILGQIEADPKTVDVSEAEVIMAAGRGVEAKEDFERFELLAELIGASVGGSRPLVDNQWIGFDRQIGQSGKTVTPKIYIGCGISGSNYHVQGMKDSKLILCINKDKRAPFFKIADVSVVADLKEIIPEMIELLRQRS